MVTRKKPKETRDRFVDELDPILDGLHRTSIRLTGDAGRAEDVLQDAILKGYRFFSTFQEGTNFRAWMHRVLYTVFVNTTRDRGPRASALDSVPEPEDLTLPLAAELNRPTHVERSRAVMESVDERIKQAVGELPDELRTVFLLSTIEGLKYREIADVMGCPLGTVMSRLFRSRRMLQERLTDYAQDQGFDVEAASYGEGRPQGENS
jgi:RNA polymerase sigma-70 factor (ECF subfamily)